MAQEVLVESIKKHRNINTEEMLTNKEIDFGRSKKELRRPNLSGDEVKQRPDIQFWGNISKEEDIVERWKLFIRRISVPFGRGDKEDMHSNTLKNVSEFKKNKYAPLVRSINKQLKDKYFKEKIGVEFLPFVISSLGALPK
jgi:hypothetical protein